MVIKATTSYQRISEGDISNEENDWHLSEQTTTLSQRINKWRVLFCMTLVNVALFLFSFVLWRSTSFYSSCEKVSCSLQNMSAYSPLLNKIDVTIHDVKVNGTFWPQNPPSVYQQRPSPAVDAAWERVGNLFPVPLSAADIKKTGKDPEQCFRFPASTVDGRNDIYMGMADVFHQIHCLDSFRRAFWSEYYGDLRETFRDHAFPFDDHMLHCQYLLLQTLMCHADLEVVTFNKVEGLRGPFADFSVQKKCRDFESILEWQEANQIIVPDSIAQDTSPGIKEIPAVGNSLPLLKEFGAFASHS